jgi:hypothetical protein
MTQLRTGASIVFRAIPKGLALSEFAVSSRRTPALVLTDYHGLSIVKTWRTTP